MSNLNKKLLQKLEYVYPTSPRIFPRTSITLTGVLGSVCQSATAIAIYISLNSFLLILLDYEGIIWGDTDKNPPKTTENYRKTTENYRKPTENYPKPTKLSKTHSLVIFWFDLEQLKQKVCLRELSSLVFGELNFILLSEAQFSQSATVDGR